MGRREGRHAVMPLSSILCSVHIGINTCNNCHITLRNAPTDEADEVVVYIWGVEVDLQQDCEANNRDHSDADYRSDDRVKKH